MCSTNEQVIQSASPGFPLSATIGRNLLSCVVCIRLIRTIIYPIAGTHCQTIAWLKRL